MLGEVRSAGPNWHWECWVLPCPVTHNRSDPQVSRDGAEESLVGHLRAYHSASGGDVDPGKRARRRAAAAKRTGVTGVTHLEESQCP